MFKFLRRIAGIGICLYCAVTLAMIGWTFVWPDTDPENFATADAIICLGGGMAPDGTLAPAVHTRIDRCVALYGADRAPVIIFTGGTARPQGPDAGTQMAAYAVSLGLPAEAAIIEGNAQSTLQNALFSLDLAPQARRLILVTEAFHLPRSWASFKWAAWDMGLPDLHVALAMSEPVRRTPQGQINWRILGRESIAIWFNIARAAVYSSAANPSLDWLH